MAIQPKNDTAIKVDTISEKTGSAGVSIGSTLKVDTIEDGTGAAGVNITDTLKVNTIAERTATSGVTIDSLLVKDGGLPGYIVESGSYDEAPLVWDNGNSRWKVGGSFTDYSGSVTLGTSSGDLVVNSGGSTINFYNYQEIGKSVMVHGYIVFNFSSGSASQFLTVSVPSTPAQVFTGFGAYSQASDRGVLRVTSSSSTAFFAQGDYTTWSSTDASLFFTLIYTIS